MWVQAELPSIWGVSPASTVAHSPQHGPLRAAMTFSTGSLAPDVAVHGGFKERRAWSRSNKGGLDNYINASDLNHYRRVRRVRRVRTDKTLLFVLDGQLSREQGSRAVRSASSVREPKALGLVPMAGQKLRVPQVLPIKRTFHWGCFLQLLWLRPRN